MRTSILNGLGPALRWLRDRRGRKQYQIAGEAGITKGMLSAYETGRQRPSLETLDKILDTLGCDLNDLHNALQIVNGRPPVAARPVRPQLLAGGAAALASGGGIDVYGILGLAQRLPEQEERALSEMLGGFYRFLRFLHTGASLEPSGSDEPEEPEGSGPDEGGE